MSSRQLDAKQNSALNTQSGQRQWMIVFRLPTFTIWDIICLAHGGSPDVSQQSSQTTNRTESLSCATVLSENYDLTEMRLIQSFGSLGIGRAKTLTRTGTKRMGSNIGLSGTETGAQVTYFPSSSLLKFEGSFVMFGIPLLPFRLVKSFKKPAGKAASPTAPFSQTRANSPARRRRRAAGGEPLVIGVEFTSDSLVRILNYYGADDQWVIDAIEMVGGYLDFAIGLVYSSAPVNRIANPKMVPDLDCLSGMVEIPKGIMLVFSTRLPPGPCKPCAIEGEECKSYKFCKFVRKYLGDPTLSVWIGFGGSGVSFGALLSNIILARDNCGSTPGWSGEGGRATDTMYVLDTVMSVRDTVGCIC